MPDATLATLLGKDEPRPFDVAGRSGASPFVIACDHAGRKLPRALGSLGLSAVELESHIAWDLGAEAVARRLGTMLDAFVIWQPYSRLVIDCNRPLGALDSIVTQSEHTLVPGNRNLAEGNADARAREVFHPYHDQIRAELDRREELGRSSIFVAMHSFTSRFEGVMRPWHIGVLFNRDARLGEVLVELLRSEGGLVVGCNQPYAASELSDYSIVQHAEHRDIPYVEIEIRQDLIADDIGQASWAERLARLLVVAGETLRLSDRPTRASP